MSQIKITLTRFNCAGKIVRGENGQDTVQASDQYEEQRFEEKKDIETGPGAESVGEQKQKFIDKISRQVISFNRDEDRKILQKKQTRMKRLIITNIS